MGAYLDNNNKQFCVFSLNPFYIHVKYCVVFCLMMALTSVLFSSQLMVPAFAVDSKKFMECNESPFCRRYVQFISHQLKLNANKNDFDPLFVVVPESVELPDPIKNNNIGVFTIRNSVSTKMLKAQILVTNKGIIRVTIDELSANSTFNRYKVTHDDVLMDSHLILLAKKSAKIQSYMNPIKNPTEFIVESEIQLFEYQQFQSVLPTYKLVVNFRPFQIHLFVNNQLSQVINGRQLMNFEQYRQKIEEKNRFQDIIPTETDRVENSQDDRVKEEKEDSINHDINSLDASEIDSIDNKNEQLKHEDNNIYLNTTTDLNEFETSILQPVEDAVTIDSRDIWESSFGGAIDYKMNGPTAVGLDIDLIGVKHLFGLPEHAVEFSLPLSFSEPYRSWNLDVFEYSINSPMALYGSVPFLFNYHSHGLLPYFTGILWVNPSETWIQVERSTSEDSIPMIDNNTKDINSWFISESGVIDILLFAGPTPQDILTQYHEATGYPTPAPLFSIGKHQCRWNYIDEQDVKMVDSQFDTYEIPYDVLWLDIEHTDGKRYFTWHPEHFPNPERMISELAQKGRKMVAIVDPHIKKDMKYMIYKSLANKNLLLQERVHSNGQEQQQQTTDFEGWCWPGTSVYPDFLDSNVREIFKKFYLVPFWPGSSDDLFVWNDMNEPSVFNKPEITCPRDILHLDGREHREVHNLYGFFFHRTTYEGLLLRNPNQRPFTLSRSFFIGSHRYGAIWTGDNMANWDHLKISIPMLLNFAVSGLSFIGSDVGGFFGNPDSELFTRWTQQGVWYPFYRDHAHIDSKRREPWLFDNDTLYRIRQSVQIRYKVLPMWYTFFMEYSILGHPIIRPLWWNHIDQMLDERLFKFQNEQFLIGDVFLIRCINTPMHHLQQHDVSPELSDSEIADLNNEIKDTTTTTHVNVPIYLPTRPTNKQHETLRPLIHWFNFHTGCPIEQTDALYQQSINLDAIPVFVRAGSIIITRDRIRRSSTLQLRDPMTMMIYPQLSNELKSTEVKASGRIFIDDTQSFHFRNDLKEFIYDEFQLTGTLDTTIVLQSDPSFIHIDPKFNRTQHSFHNLNINLSIEKIIMFGLTKQPKKVVISYNDNKDTLLCPIYVEEQYCSLNQQQSLYRLEIKTSSLIHISKYDWKLSIQFDNEL